MLSGRLPYPVCDRFIEVVTGELDALGFGWSGGVENLGSDKGKEECDGEKR